MSRRGACADDAAMERFFSTVKAELGEHGDRDGLAKERLFDDIEVFYNRQRRQLTVGLISPVAFERRAVT
jgi:transposase InsO family protein